MIYDTLKLTKAMEGPFTREQAEAVTEALVTSTLDTVATKSDIVLVRADITDLKAEMIRWIVGAIVLNLFGTAGLVLALVKLLAR